MPAVAASLVTREHADFVEPAAFVRRLVDELLRHGDGQDKRLLNVNLPHRPHAELRGVRFTRLGTRVYSDTLVEKTDPRGRAYYWIGGQDPVWGSHDGTDFHAVEHGYISVTPLALDLTDHHAMTAMARWDLAP